MEIRGTNVDQVHTLRVLSKEKGKHRNVIPSCGLSSENRANERSGVRILAVVSGKGGVGKTNVAVNIAYGLAKRSRRVMVLDADAGLANIDVLLGLSPRYHLGHVFSGQKKLRDIIVRGPAGILILPASSGIQELTDLNQDQHLSLMADLSGLCNDIDVLMIDTGAGISKNVTFFSLLADEIIVLATSEPTSITDAYALMKVLSIKYGEKSFKLLVNAIRNAEEAKDVHWNLSTVAKSFLNISIDYLGYVLHDDNIPRAVRKQRLLMDLYPNSRASLCFEKLIRIIDKEPDGSSRNS
ncbi:MAG: MinD/ParA family protein [Deltaproteobacteria bacterium]|nr:MinD/ParA family protein [Deltaproteobacteria bacterium]MBW2307924.1 MinD/ParA family protein [Deltaproteobacteria bacterium]